MSEQLSASDTLMLNEHVQSVQRLLVNYFTSRRSWLDRMTDPRRDIDAECGHPKDIEPQQYVYQYRRNPIAKRVVAYAPEDTWLSTPEVNETEDVTKVTKFEREIIEVGNSLLSEQSFYDDKEANVLWSYTRQIDEQCGINRYGIMLLGIDDGKDLSEPVAGVKEVNSVPGGDDAPTVNSQGVPAEQVRGRPYGITWNQTKSKRKLLYIRCLPEYLAQISQYETNWSSPRFQQPVYYEVTLDDPNELFEGIGVFGATGITKKVHWTRVIHVVDNPYVGNIFGIPRQEDVFNRLLNLEKLYGPSAEMYYKGAFPGLVAKSIPQLAEAVKIDKPAVRDAMEKFWNSLERILIAENIDVAQLAPTVVDPSPQIERLLDSICIVKNVPRRIFMGSDLKAGTTQTQEDPSWDRRRKARQKYHAIPRIVVPLINRLISLGCLSTPERYHVSWPDVTSQTGRERSAFTFQMTQALAQYVTSEAWRVMSLQDFFVRVFGMTEKEAKTVEENARKQLKELEKRMMPLELSNAPVNGTTKRPPGTSGGNPADGGGGSTGQRRVATPPARNEENDVDESNVDVDTLIPAGE